jgi:hypothetical protein
MAEIPDRIASKLVRDDQTGCLVWTGSMNDGYGQVSVEGRMVRVHRFVYETLVGPIPEGLVIDHTCRNRACSNVQHLRVVTHRVNLLVGETIAAANAAKTVCAQGHPLTGANVYIAPRTPNKRICRTCLRSKWARAARRKRSSSPR